MMYLLELDYVLFRIASESNNHNWNSSHGKNVLF